MVLLLIIVGWLVIGAISYLISSCLDLETGEVIHTPQDWYAAIALSILGPINIYYALITIWFNEHRNPRSFHLFYRTPKVGDMVEFRGNSDSPFGYVEVIDDNYQYAYVTFTTRNQSDDWYLLSNLAKL